MSHTNDNAMNLMNDAIRDFGGNVIRSVATTQPGEHLFADSAYRYLLVVVDDSLEIRVSDLQSYTIFVLAKAATARLEIVERGQFLKQGDALQVESENVVLSARGHCRLLVAGTQQQSDRPRSVTVTPAAAVYRVVKPWGHELWINGQHPNYALKQIAIKSGTKTSLQYHNYKQETNVLFEGKARLHFKKDPSVMKETMTAEHVGIVDLESVSVIDVSPPTVHRLEALTDVLLYEVSTPHLDDVVRIQDDARRPDGRIPLEHQR
jgi:mannose-6-phosphate isomerase